MEQAFKGKATSLKTTLVNMKKMFIMLFAMMMMFLNASANTNEPVTVNAKAKPVKVNLQKESLTFKGVTYTYGGYVCKEAYHDLEKATWAIVIPKPQGTNWIDDGDYIELYQIKGRYFYCLHGKVFEFNSTSFSSRDEKVDTLNWEEVDGLEFAHFGDPAFANGQNIGYVYLDKGDDRFVMVYGNEKSYIK